MSLQAWIPRATYRWQFNRDFRFSDATALVAYLAQLGVSHCYASPYLKARPGSSHGYDIVDHASLNPEIGSVVEFEQFSAAMTAAGLGHMLDIVPNHMGVGSDNVWWLDVLENGMASRYARYFDIDWQPIRESLHGKVLLPVLGNTYGEVLEKGELKLVFDAERGSFTLHYFEHFFPIDPASYAFILQVDAEAMAQLLSQAAGAYAELQSLITAFGHLPQQDAASPEKIAERERDKEFHKRRLAELCTREPAVASAIQSMVAVLNGKNEDAASFDKLHELIKAQAFHLAYWRVAADDINYRRFFDVKELAGLCMEQAEVFEATHSLIFDLVQQRKVHALRIDHPDGLYDPEQYFVRLQTGLAQRLAGAEGQATEVAADGQTPAAPAIERPFYLLVEKIVAHDERLPDTWPIHGTTGYHFTNLVNSLFVDNQAEALMSKTYAAFIGETMVFDDVLYRAKKLIMKVTLASELNVLVGELGRIAQASRQTCDFTLHSLRDALMEVVACFPVYRTYITTAGVSDDDRRYIESAVNAAKRRAQAADLSVFDFVRDAMLTRLAENKPAGYAQSVLTFAMNMQQFTSPVMAKGMEDTSFYIYNRLVSLNEVGGDPRIFGISVDAFHAANSDRARRWPHTMLASSTHDTKRSEDVRARINVLSEIASEWRAHLSRWHRLNRGSRQEIDGAPVPSANDEYLLYQTLLGIWPLTPPSYAEREQLCKRVQDYMRKVVREAKTLSSWIHPNPTYEAGLESFIAALFDPKLSRRFLKDFLSLQQRVAWAGMLNGLAQLILKLTLPGVPDIYQGNELWDFSVVDPDNRRAVDYATRQTLLAEVIELYQSEDSAKPLNTLLQSMSDGRIKLFLTWRLLQLRKQYETLFRDGDYLPLQVSGTHAQRICAFARQSENQLLVVIVQRLAGPLGAVRGELPLGERWADSWIDIPQAAGRTGVDVFSKIHMSVAHAESAMGSGLAAATVFAIAPFSVIDFSDGA